MIKMEVKVTYIQLDRAVTETLSNVDSTYVESEYPACEYYWVRRIHENKRIVTKYPWDKVISIEEFYDD